LCLKKVPDYFADLIKAQHSNPALYSLLKFLGQIFGLFASVHYKTGSC